MSRLQERIERVFALGDRIGYTAAEDEAHALARGWMEEAGLEVEVDAAGNLIGRVPGGGREVWTGSHLDSVPSGGRFDGVLGVLGGLEAVERLGLAGLAVVAFRDEERGCAGSRARVGSGAVPDAYLELHIEQGPRLERADVPLAAVTGIVGYSRQTVTVTGRAGHAGTTPMEGREDALVAAAERILAIREAAAAIPDAVATVGTITVDPGGVNVIPGEVSFTVDARAPGPRPPRRAPRRDRPRDRRRRRARCDGPGRGGRDARGDRGRGRAGPRARLRRGPRRRDLASAGVAAGMLFVRSRNGGISHNPDEWSDPEDCALAVDVLADALLSAGQCWTCRRNATPS